MSQQLSYLQVVDDGGRAVVEPGVVRTDQVDTLGRKHPLRGRGLRLYQAETTSDGLSFGSLSALVANVQRALREIVAEFRITATYPDTAPQFVLKAFGDHTRFASLDLAKHKVELLELPPGSSLDELVDHWARGKGLDHLLLELNASTEVLRSLERQIAADIARSQVLVTPVIQPATAALPAETVASAQRRAAMAREWVDAAAVSSLLGSTAENKSQLPTRLRREGKILGVWVVADNRYRFPLWQFKQNQLIPEFREILALLRSERGVGGGRQTSGWEEIEWLCAPHALLAKQRPAELLTTAPERVLDVARHEFTENPDARW